MNIDATTAVQPTLRSGQNYSTEAPYNKSAQGIMRNGLSVTENKEPVKFVADLEGNMKTKNMSEIKVTELECTLRSSQNYSTETPYNKSAQGIMRNGLSVTENKEPVEFVADLQGTMKTKNMSELKVTELGYDRTLFNALNTFNNRHFCRSHSAPTGDIMKPDPERISKMESQPAVNDEKRCKSLPW